MCSARRAAEGEPGRTGACPQARAGGGGWWVSAEGGRSHGSPRE